MSLRLTTSIYRKEMLETLRDRRTLIVMVVLPVCLYPIVGITVSQWVGVHESRRSQQVSRVGFSGARWDELEQFLVQSGPVQVTSENDEEQLNKGKVDLLLDLPPELEEVDAAGSTVNVELIFDETKDRSIQAKERVRRILYEYAEQLRLRRLDIHQLPVGMMRPLEVHQRSIARPKAAGAKHLAGFVPLVVVLMVLLGAFYPSIDLTAGEKERGTLETLLVAPVSRRSIIAGKYLVVVTVATFTGLLNMGSIGLTFTLGFGPALRAAGVAASIPVAALVLTTVSMVFMAFFFSAIMLAAAALARSFKEAQNLLTPIYLVCMLPAMAAQLPGMTLSVPVSIFPVMNLALLTRDLIAGRMTLLPTVVTLVTTGIYTVGALAVATRVFESERLLFPPDPSLKRARRASRPILATQPRASHAALLLLSVMALILLVGQRVQAADTISGILITEWGLIGLPVLLAIRWGRLDRRSALGLWGTGRLVMVGAALAGVSAWYLVGAVVETLQQRIMPIPPEMIEAFHRAILAPQRSLLVDLFALALSPAICEEALFRGVILRATRPLMSARWAILINGLLFGLFHLNPYKIVPTMLLGMILALITLRSGSILPAVLFHFLNNACAIVAGRLFGMQEVGSVAESSASIPLILGALVIFGLGLGLVMRQRPQGPPSK